MRSVLQGRLFKARGPHVGPAEGPAPSADRSGFFPENIDKEKIPARQAQQFWIVPDVLTGEWRDIETGAQASKHWKCSQNGKGKGFLHAARVRAGMWGPRDHPQLRGLARRLPGPGVGLCKGLSAH